MPSPHPAHSDLHLGTHFPYLSVEVLTPALVVSFPVYGMPFHSQAPIDVRTIRCFEQRSCELELVTLCFSVLVSGVP